MHPQFETALISVDILRVMAADSPFADRGDETNLGVAGLGSEALLILCSRGLLALPPRLLGARLTNLREPLADFRKKVLSASTINAGELECRRLSLIFPTAVPYRLNRFDRGDSLGLSTYHLALFVTLRVWTPSPCKSDAQTGPTCCRLSIGRQIRRNCRLSEALLTNVF